MNFINSDLTQEDEKIRARARNLTMEETFENKQI